MKQKWREIVLHISFEDRPGFQASLQGKGIMRKFIVSNDTVKNCKTPTPRPVSHHNSW